MQECKRNDARAQEVVYRRYVDAMLVLCMRYLPDRQEAQEAMMDGFYRAFTKMSTFEWRGEGSLAAWMRRIMVYQCIDRLRSRKQVHAAMTEDVDSTDAGDDEMLGRLAAKEIMQLLQELPDGYRTVFNLYVFEGMGHAAIGELLGITESTSKSQLHRARGMMKQKLEQADKKA